jgi:hypothetical protein
MWPCYSVIVVISTCLAWGLDADVRQFLDRRKTAGNVLLLTTSADGSWLPDKDDRDFDAISGASVKENVPDMARNLLAKIQKRLSNENQR